MHARGKSPRPSMEPLRSARATARADGNRPEAEVWSRDDDVPFSLGSSVAPMLLTRPCYGRYQPKVSERSGPLDVDRRNGLETRVFLPPFFPMLKRLKKSTPLAHAAACRKTAEVFAVMFAGQCPPMGSNVA